MNHLQVPSATVPTDAFRTAVRHAALVSGARVANPADKAIHLHSDGGSLRVTSQFGETRLTEVVKAPELPPFQTAARTHDVARILQVHKEPRLPIGVSDRKDPSDAGLMLYASKPGLTYLLDRFETVDAVEPVASAAPPVTLSAEELLAGLKAVRYAVNRENFQAAFQYLHFCTEQGRDSYLFGSDGYRVALYDVSQPLPPFRLNLRDYGVLVALLRATGEEKVSLTALETESEAGLVTKLQVQGAGFVLHLAGADAETPNWHRAAPSPRVTLKWPRRAVLNILEGLSLVGERTANNRIVVIPSKTELEFFVESDQGYASGKVPLAQPVKSRVSDIFGQSFAFNGQYLMDAVRHAPGEELDVGFEQPHRPIAVDCDDYHAIVVGLRS